MALISVPSGKDGVLILGASSLFLEEWDMSLDIDNELYMHFNQTADANSLIFKAINAGHVTGEASIRGKFDNTGGAYLPSSKSIWVGGSGVGWLGYSATVGFNITYAIINIRAAQAVSRPAGAMYEARIKITACLFNAAGP